MFRSLLNLIVTTAQKYIDFHRSYIQKYAGVFFIAALNGELVFTCIIGVSIFT